MSPQSKDELWSREGLQSHMAMDKEVGRDEGLQPGGTERWVMVEAN